MNLRSRVLPAVLALAVVAMPQARVAAQVAPIRGEVATGFGGRPWMSYTTHVEIRPARVQLGGRAIYRAWLVVPQNESARWIPPVSGGAFTWGKPRASRTRGFPTVGPSAMMTLDTVRVEVPLQIFALGEVVVPGVRVWLPYVLPADRESIRPMPTLTVNVTPVLAIADSSADLRPLRGPLAAPWWERVHWGLVGALAAALIALGLLIRWASRRKRIPVPTAIAVPVARLDPAAEALAELAALRRLDLPTHGRFGDHALHLTRIVRRYLESTAQSSCPGDTTPELVDHLRTSRLDHGTVQRLEGLLRGWDRLKFARAESSIEEARRAEAQAESLFRRPSAPAAIGKVA